MARGFSYQNRPFLNPRESFLRDDNDLINPDIYLPYLVDHPDDAPIIMTREQRDVDVDDWVYQHVYFQKNFYMQKGEPDWLKDWVLSQFCTIPYNQIAMRRWMEQELHNTYEEHVIAPDTESMRRALIDFQKLDFLGAAALGKRVALVPEALNYLSPGAGRAAGSSVASPQERAIYFDGIAEDMLDDLSSPLVVPEVVITSAIKRMSKMFGTERLDEEVKNRLPLDCTYLPVGLRHPSVYYQVGTDMLKDASLLEDNKKRYSEVGITALQTGVNRLELVA